MSQISKEAFRRQNESPEEVFYRVPRLVTHINAQNYKTTGASLPCPACWRSS